MRRGVSCAGNETRTNLGWNEKARLARVRCIGGRGGWESWLLVFSLSVLLVAGASGGIAWAAVLHQFEVLWVDEPVTARALGGESARIDEGKDPAGGDLQNLGGLGGGDHCVASAIWDLSATNFFIHSISSVVCS